MSWKRALVLLAFVTLGAAAAALAYFIRIYMLSSGEFNFSTLVVEEKSSLSSSGQRPLKKEELEKKIRAILEPEVGRNIFSIDESKLQTQITSLKWIETALVRKELPGRMVVKYVPRKIEAVFADPESGVFHYLDIKGTPFDTPSQGTSLDFPLVVGCSINQPSCLLEGVAYIQEIMKIKPLVVSELAMAKDGLLVVTLMKPMRSTITIGNIIQQKREDILYRMTLLPIILNEAASRNFSIRKLDMTYDNKAVAVLD